MIDISGVSKIYESEKAVDSLTMQVQQGSIFGLLGSNGAGKTTLLKMLAGIIRPDEGTITLEGREIYEQPEVKRRVLFVPDSPYFFPQSNLRQMADFYRSIYSSWSEERFSQLSSIFKLDPRRKLHRMSKGMRRQAAFWLALSSSPDLLILDEPIDGLDPVMRRHMKNLLFQYAAERQMTVVISSHNLREIEDMCDHVGIMHKGCLLLHKEIDDLRGDIHKIQVAFKESAHLDELEQQLDILHKEQRGTVLLYIIRGDQLRIKNVFASYQPLVMDLLPLTLEEIFIYEMGDAGYAIQPILL
ncbi:ABC transporter ATP-binding protein [Paenibacillus massiliensis]|uniref:ABC transporter ATP-binding protein n=1 Tax=Paenibacillus massiliensis TaxID=225917 RepID=UPI00041E3244|nr:ABC transporter ATP-binding protein [Paenibacillus massiliensis]